MRNIIIPLLAIVYFYWSYISIKDIREAIELSYHYANRSLFFSSYINWSTVIYIGITTLILLLMLATLLVIYW